MRDITAEQKTLLNIGQISGLVESSVFGDCFRYSIAKLSFELINRANLSENSDIANLLSDSSEPEFTGRFVKLFLEPPRKNSCSERLREIHRQMFSHKEGFQSHPGEWADETKAGQIDGVIDSLETDTSPFKTAIRLHEFVLKLQPFNDGNKRIAALAPNYYLQSTGLTPYPLFTFHNPPPIDEANQWFAEQSEKMVRILRGINRLGKTYADRTNGLATQRKKLLTKLLPHMMRRPKFGIQEILDDYGEGTFQTISLLAKEIKEPPINILEETTGYSRFRVFNLHEYTKLFNELI